MKGIQTLPSWCLQSRMGMKQVISFQGESKCCGDLKGKNEPTPSGNLGRLREGSGMGLKGG